ncbi:sulfurtransferase complex subunit TusB [candidate division WOR-3 bacterium]|nr:sulfurtransferase complex subunit TusB [candidate division WOR-3 bacterium]
MTKNADEETIALLSRTAEADQDDALVLVQDGVYLLMKQEFSPACPLYALRPDVSARGIKTEANQITYADLVDLILRYDRAITL